MTVTTMASAMFTVRAHLVCGNYRTIKWTLRCDKTSSCCLGLSSCE